MSFYTLPAQRDAAQKLLLDALERHYLLAEFTPADFAGFDEFTRDYALISDRLNEDLEVERGLAAQEAMRRQHWWETRLAWHKSTPLPQGWIITDKRAYGAAWLHALVAEQPERQRNYHQLAALICVSKASVPTYLAYAGLKNESQIVAVPVRSAAEVRAAQHEHHARVCSYEATYPDGRTVNSYYAADSAFVEEHTAAGATVMVELQGASKQRIVRETPPEKPPRREMPCVAALPVVEAVPAPPKPPPPSPRIEPERERYLRRQLSLALRLCETPTRGSNWILPTGELVAKRADSKTLLRALLAVLDERNERKRPKASDLVF